jgi:hypothetical protein
MKTNLHAVPKRKPGPTFAQLRKAVSLFRLALVPRSVRHANARKWLIATERLGHRHILRGGAVTWGARQRPGSMK